MAGKEVIKIDKNKLKAVFPLILALWMITILMSLNFYDNRVYPYRYGYQYWPTFPKYQMIATDGYKIEYIPDNPLPGDNILVLINFHYFDIEDFPCKDCILSGYFTNENGVKYTLFENSKVGNNGVQFIYPGRQVEIIMNHQNGTYKFFVPLPSFKQSLILALNDSIVARIILPLNAVLAMIAVYLSYLQRQLIRQNIGELLRSIKREIDKVRKRNS